MQIKERHTTKLYTELTKLTEPINKPMQKLQNNIDKTKWPMAAIFICLLLLETLDTKQQREIAIKALQEGVEELNKTEDLNTQTEKQNKQ